LETQLYEGVPSMNDLPINRPVGSDTGGRPSIPPDELHREHDFRRDAGAIRSRVDSRPVGLGTAIGFFAALLFLFVMAAAVAQFAVRGDRNVGNAPAAPPVTQDQTPAQPSPPADGNPAGNTSRDAVTP
jgi:hypothetical protein